MDLNRYLPPRVAVIEITGMIGPRVNARDTTRLLREVGANARLRAVVLDIDSPGGSAPASEAIYLAVRKLAQKKPVIAAIRGTGASGSYMIACGARRIVAVPTALVGSIGVVSYHPVLEALLARAGVEVRIAKTGEFKDMGSFFRDATTAEREKEEALLHGIHERFVEIVTEGRPNLPADRVRAMATGEIHTGAQAAELGLIDTTGDLDDAVTWAAQEARIGPETMLLRPRRSLLQVVMQRGATAFFDGVEAALFERAAQARIRA